MGQFKDMTIKSIVEELNASYFLPDIQREYVWLNNEKEKKIEQLFDSILRGYPIGSFLFWKLKKSDIETNRDANENSGKLNFQLYKFIENYDVRNTHNIKIDVMQINSNDLSIVLDGQQRLTSLYIGLVGSRTLKRPYSRRGNPNAYETKRLFINLRYIPSTDNPDDNYQFEFLNPADVPVPNEKTFWFRVGDILTMDSLLTFSRANDLADTEYKILEKLQRAFCIESLISYFEETEKNLDKMLKIFIRVNSGGTQLSYSDLLMSILTANFSSDIRDMMNKLVDNLQEQGFGVMGRDQILKTCLLLTESNHIFQLRNFCKNNIRKIETNWTQITDKIYEAVRLLQEFGYRDHLASAYILSTIALYFFKYQKTCKELTAQEKEALLQFVRIAQIKSYFTTSLDNRLKDVADAMRSNATVESFNQSMQKKGLRLQADDIDQMLELQYGNPAVLPVLQLLYPHLDYKNSKFHIDHIYPKANFRNNPLLPSDYLGRANFLYNLQLLQGEENLDKRAKDPEVWLAEYFNRDQTKIDNYKCQNYIQPTLQLDWENIAMMEQQRGDGIKQKLRELLLKN